MESMVVQGQPGSKALWRQVVQSRLEAMTVEDRATQGQGLRYALEQWTTTRSFEVILATLPLEEEPDLTPFLRDWLAHGRVALARTGPQRSLNFRYVTTLDGPWETKKWGLREPSATLPCWEPGPRTLCLVPGLAFAPRPDGRFDRLGRGAGYYDRWLAEFGGEVVTLGFGFSVQALDALPVEPHDQSVAAWLGPLSV